MIFVSCSLNTNIKHRLPQWPRPGKYTNIKKDTQRERENRAAHHGKTEKSYPISVVSNTYIMEFNIIITTVSRIIIRRVSCVLCVLLKLIASPLYLSSSPFSSFHSFPACHLFLAFVCVTPHFIIFQYP